ncbi:unnamed protein product [Ambrosiozyma monospora]|uniref:Unnamed protein product n=1 Tax=Ambrosiozyma monospora TaxID=43982 RepID=A0A9W6Z1D6_AMBMO|nr:unnamed protein product [Ambrosiozyma monospora]
MIAKLPSGGNKARKVHPSIHSAFIKLFEMEKEVFSFSYSQLCQLLRVYHKTFFIHARRSTITFSCVPQPLDDLKCNVQWDLCPNDSRSVFRLTKPLPVKHNHDIGKCAKRVGISPNVLGSTSDESDEESEEDEDIETVSPKPGTKDTGRRTAGAIPVGIPENKLFHIDIEPNMTPKERTKMLNQYVLGGSFPNSDDASISETFKKLMNIKDEIYSFTVSQLLQFLCAYHNTFSLFYKKPKTYILFKLTDGGQLIRLLRIVMIYYPVQRCFHLFSVPLNHSDKRAISIRTRQRNHDASIPVKIPENEKLRFMPDKFNTKAKSPKSLTEYSLDVNVPIPFHPSFNETYLNIFNMKNEEYEFTSSQFIQFLIVFWTEFWSNSQILETSIIVCFSRNDSTQERCSATFTAVYEPDQDKFYVRRRSCHHNHVATGYQTTDGTNVSTRTKIEKLYGIYSFLRPTIDFFISISAVSVDIPEINGLPIDSNTGLESTLYLIRKDPNLVCPPSNHHSSIHLTYAKLFFNKGLFHIFTHSQLFQFMRIYNNCFRLSETRGNWSLVCKVKSFDGHECAAKYCVRYMADKNVFVVYSTQKTWTLGHSHRFPASLSLVGLKLSDINLQKLDEGDTDDMNQHIDTNSKVVEVGEPENDTDDPDEETICGSSDGVPESGEKQTNSEKRSDNDRHAIDKTPLSVGPKSMVVVLKYRKRVPQKGDQLEIGHDNSMVSNSRASDDLNQGETTQPAAVHSLSRSTTKGNCIIPELTKKECFETSEVINCLSHAGNNVHSGGSIDDMRSFKNDIHELMYFTQRIFDSTSV